MVRLMSLSKRRWSAQNFFRYGPVILCCLAPVLPHASSRSQVKHPREEYRVRPSEARVITVDRQEPPLPSAVAGVVESLRRARKVTSIGVDAGDRHEMLGGIEAPTFGPLDYLFVLDDSFNELRAYSSRTGRFANTVGGTGQGPGEFLSPLSIAADWDRSLLYVGDATRQLHIFSIPEYTQGAHFTYRDSLTIGVLPKGVCVADDHLVVHGMKLAASQTADPRNIGAPILHFVSTDGIYDSFGSIYEAPNAIINAQIYDGPIACSTARDRILHAPRIVLGEVWGYAFDGTPRWIVELAEFTPRRLESLASGGTYFGPVLPGLNQIDSVVLIDMNYLLVQEMTVKIDDLGPRRAGFHSYLIDVDSGDAYYIGADLPWIRAAHDNLYLSVQEEPYPRITVWQRTHPGEVGSQTEVSDE